MKYLLFFTFALVSQTSWADIARPVMLCEVSTGHASTRVLVQSVTGMGTRLVASVELTNEQKQQTLGSGVVTVVPKPIQLDGSQGYFSSPGKLSFKFSRSGFNVAPGDNNWLVEVRFKDQHSGRNLQFKKKMDCQFFN